MLTADDLIDISLSAPEGSGAVRTLKIHYRQNGEEHADTLEDISRIEHKGYDNEEKEQAFAASDYDGDGIVDIIVYQEFWFPDLSMSHVEVPEWPTVYEYDLDSGFVVASAKHREYFNTYITASEEKLDSKECESELAALALEKLIYAAGEIADGRFAPTDFFNGQYYTDVYEITKEAQE